MKRILLLLLLIAPFLCQGQTSTYYYSNGSKQNIIINNNRLLVYFDKSLINLEEVNTKYNIIREIILSGEKSERFAAMEISINTDSTDFLKCCNYVYGIEPVIGLESPVPVSNIFYVKIRTLGDIQLLQEKANVMGVNITGQIPYLPLWYSLETSKNSLGNALEMSNYFFETGLFEDVDPGFVYTVFYNTLNCTSDIELGTQWGLDAINACDAWQTTKGNSNIRVALLDSGLDEGHLEFNGTSIVASYDAQNNWSPINTSDYGAHGTQVGGIMFANHNNQKIAGVCPSASLMNIRVPSDTVVETYIQNMISAYTYANNNNVDVLNNSWGIPQTRINGTSASSLMSLIQNVFTTYRNGKGGVAVFVSGNDNPYTDLDVLWPANSCHEAIVVGGIDNTLTRSGLSCYGYELDVVAPGGNIHSTKLNNNDGYFSGTSYAAPHVSGVAALMLSVNNSLTSEQVSRIIKGTAQKVGGYSYQYSADHLNGTWHEEMGHGLVDAYAAVSAAQATPNYDLYVRDNTADDGTEPNTTTSSVSASPDIVIKDLNGNIVNYLNSGESYRINITVHNKNTSGALLNKSNVKVHWTFTSGNLQWENSWSNAGSICGISKSGTVAGTNGLLPTPINPGGSTTISIPWTAPTFETVSCHPNLPNTMYVTMLAEVVDGGLTIGKTASDYPLEHYVRTNNNIARKTYTVWMDQTMGRLTLSPNPAYGQTVVTCELSDNISEATVVISGITGHVVYNSTVTPTSAERTVDLQGMPAGQYVAQLIYRGEVLDAKQLLVE